MSDFTVRVPRDFDWLPSDQVELLLGSENAADLATSTPAGGTVVADISPWQDGIERGGLGADPLGEAPLGFSSIGYGLGEGELGFGALGINDAPRLIIEHTYRPTDKCASIPVGVQIRDKPGNVQSGPETTATLADPPKGARGLATAATASPREVQLTWTESSDV